MKLPLLVLAIAVVCTAQPTVSAVQNNYSYILPGLPNYGIAQGSIFVLYGTNLANTSTALQSAPLKTLLEGVSVSVTVSGQTRAVILYYVTPTQIAGILPSSTPVGTGTITVTNNGRTSPAIPMVVVQSSFGILTLDGSGRGPAAVYDARNSFLTTTNAARPGDTIVLYGTGAGPSQGDETGPQTQTNLANVPILVEIGGRPAQVLYHGRTVFPGLDQVNIVVPSGVSPGCAVTLTVGSGTFVSNFTTIPVTTSGTTCTTEGGDPNLIITDEERARWVAAGNYTSGSVGLTRSTSYTFTDNPTTTTTTRSDTFSAGFSRISGNIAPLFNSTFLVPNVGSCMTTSGLVNPFPDLVYKTLDAGATLTSIGPAGIRTVPRSTDSPGFIGYSATVGNGTAGNYLEPGSYTINGPGGTDIGSFSGRIEIAPELVWTNRTSLETVDRASPITLTWSGGEPTTLVTLQGLSTIIRGTTVISASFQCWAKNTDGRFTIPASVMATLPATGTIRGSLAIATVGRGTRITATGLDYGTLGSQFGVAQSVIWK